MESSKQTKTADATKKKKKGGDALNKMQDDRQNVERMRELLGQGNRANIWKSRAQNYG